MKKYRFHLLGLVHLPAHQRYSSCAFTQKNRKLAKMLASLGHEVFFYGAEGSDILDYAGHEKGAIHYIQTHTLADIAKDYGDGDNRFEIGYNWHNVDFRHDLNIDKKPSTKKFYQSCISHINKVKRPDDFLLCTQGWYHKPIADAVNLFLTVESGIGYRGSVRGWFRSFESHHIQSFTYGSENPFGDMNGSYYDRVIPNYFDPADVEFSDTKDDYFLFIGRMIKRKGVLTAYLTTKAIGAKLIMAGQGAFRDSRGYLIDNHPKEFEIPNDSDLEYIGFADTEKRKKLMAKAKAVFVPTEYLEIFGGVHVEAMLSGTPVITTDFGVFGGNTFEHGVQGFKCNTLQDFVDAARACQKFTSADYQRIRRHAERFFMDNVKLQYQKWFDDLHQVFLSTDGKTPGWHYLGQTSTRT